MTTKHHVEIPDRISTANHIANVTEALLDKMPLDSITVKMIVDASGTSRTTFYRHFTDKYDVVLWIYKTKADKIVSSCSAFSTKTLEIYYFMYDKKGFFARALSYNDQNCLGDYINERSFSDLEELARKHYRVSEVPKSVREDIQFFCAGCNKTWHNWIFGKMEETPEELLSIIMRNMPQSLREFLK